MAGENSSYIRELKRAEQKERDFLKKREIKRRSLLNALAGDKIPEGARKKLQEAFSKAFEVLFEKGLTGMNRSINRVSRENRWEDNIRHAQILRDTSAFRNLSREANKDSAMNMVLSGMTGMGLGVLGVGIPDIPVFTAMMLRDVCIRALNYGYDYIADEEKYFILLIVRGAFLRGSDLAELNRKANQFIKRYEIPEDTDLEREIKWTAQVIADEILASKFIQTVPVVGMVGGAFDALYMARVAEYAELKYRKRMLEDYGPSFNTDSYNPVHVIHKDPERKEQE